MKSKLLILSFKLHITLKVSDLFFFLYVFSVYCLL